MDTLRNPPPFLGADAVFARLSPRGAREALEEAILAFDRGEIEASHTLGVAAREGSFHVKACSGALGARRWFVAKVNANFPANPALRGLPTIQGVIAVMDADDGRLLALVDSPSVTTLRTAAASALAARHLAPAGAKVATVVGCGVLGAAHARALAEALPLEALHLWDVEPQRAGRLARELGGELAVACTVPASLREAAQASAVIATCTPARAPVLGAADVLPGTLVLAVGADNEHKVEIELALLERARIVADSRAQAAKLGEVKQHPGLGARVCGELVDAVCGRLDRTAAHECVVFDSTGLALQDLALCARLIG